MTIDQGFTLKFNSAAPIPGVKQSSNPIRDNFAVIKRAIEAIQGLTSSDSSIFEVTPLQSNDGSFQLGVGYKNNALVLPIGDPSITPEEGMIRYHSGTLQIYNGSQWGIASGPNVSDIIAAIEGNPALVQLILNGNTPQVPVVTANGSSGLITGADKAKLDSLGPAFNNLTVRNGSLSNTITAHSGSTGFNFQFYDPFTVEVVGTEVRVGINLPQGLATANGQSGFISGADKAKLDSLITTVVTPQATGYMSAADKLKLDNLSQSFSTINVANGTLPAGSSGVLELVGQGGVSVNYVPGTQRITIGLGNIGGVTAANIATVITAVNASRSRLATALPDTTAESLSFYDNANATVNISFSWTYAGNINDIDGFRVTVNDSTNATAYSFGNTPDTERTFDVGSDKHSFLLMGATPNHYYTFFVQAFRIVDTDISPTGFILGNPRKCLTTGKDPYQPRTTVSFTGTLNGTSTGVSIDQLFTMIQQAQAGAVWNTVTGTGKPHDNADVTTLNTSLNTQNVGSRTAADINNLITNLNSNYTNIATIVQQLQSGNGIGGNTLQSYVAAAQLAQQLAQNAAGQVQTQFNSIAATKIVVEADRTTAAQARDIALAAQDAAVAAKNIAVSSASSITGSAQSAVGSANLAQTYANNASSFATAAQASYTGATLSAVQTRPYDFASDGLFWTGFTTSQQGVEYADVSSIGRVYRQSGPTEAWIAPKKNFISTAGRRVRGVVRCRMLHDGLDTNGQNCYLNIKGIDVNGGYHSSIHGSTNPVAGKSSSAILYAANGWTEFGIEFVPDSAFVGENPFYNILFTWNTAGGGAQIEIATFIIEDITESGLASVAANAAVSAQNSATTAKDQASTYAQAAQASSVTASTSASQANTYKLDAAQSAQTAQGAQATAVQQAGVATNAAYDAQIYSSSASSHSDSARSDANRAESSAAAVSTAATTATVAAQNAQTAATAASGSETVATAKATEAGNSASSANTASTAAQSYANNANSSAQAAAVSATTASTSSTSASQSATVATQSELASRSHVEGAANSATAAALSATQATTAATLTAQFSSVVEQSTLTAKIAAAALLPSDFGQGLQYWATGALGTPTARLVLPPAGTIVAVSNYGNVFQTNPQAGTIGSVGALSVKVGRVYRITMILRTLTNNTGTSALTTGYLAVLNAAMDTILNKIPIGSANPLAYSSGWVTFTKDLTSNDIGNLPYVRPLIEYNQTSGTQLIQIRQILIEDVTESISAKTAAQASVNSQTIVTAYKDQTIQYANAVTVQASQVQTSASQALSYKNSAIQAKQDAQSASAVATEQAGIAVAASLNAIQAASQSFPGNFALDSTFFTNDTSGQTVGDVGTGTFVTIT
jgi:hypothetical protein